jgi:hypothetical protein
VKRLLAAALVLFSLTSVAHAVLGRDDQWTYIAAADGHGARAELRGDDADGIPTHLIFQIECLKPDRALLFRYDASGFELPQQALSREMTLILNGYDGPTYPIQTSHRGWQMEGRLALTEEIAARVSAATYFMIYAPSDMDEPWHGGGAPALRQLVAECWGPAA